jgi:hypothetical protein
MKDTPALTELQNEKVNQLLVLLRGTKSITATKRLEIADVVEELRTWADTSPRLSSDRSDSLESLHSTTKELHQSKTLADAQGRGLQVQGKQVAQFRRDTAAVESRMLLEYILEDIWQTHDARCGTRIPIVNRHRSLFASLEHLGKDHLLHQENTIANITQFQERVQLWGNAKISQILWVVIISMHYDSKVRGTDLQRMKTFIIPEILNKTE